MGFLLSHMPVLAQGGSPTKVTSYVFQGGAGLHDNVPVTFGAVFAPGDIPNGYSVVARGADGATLRTLAQAAFISPDSDPMKQTLLRELKANFAKYDADFVRGAAQNPVYTLMGKGESLSNIRRGWTII